MSTAIIATITNDINDIVKQLHHSYMEEVGCPDTVEARRSYLERDLKALRQLRTLAENIDLGYAFDTSVNIQDLKHVLPKDLILCQR